MYAHVSTKLMRRWVFGSKQGQSVIDRQFPDSDEEIITFRDFVQTLAVREVRREHKIPLQRIRKGIDAARDLFGLDFPLAYKHRIYLFSDQKGEGHGNMAIRLGDDEESVEDLYVQLTGKAKGSFLMTQVVEMFLNDLTFDANGMASQYRPMTKNGAAILLDPDRRLGEPIVEPNGYTARILRHATTTEGGPEAAASVYGVSLDEVVLANEYMNSLTREIAA